MKLRRFLQEDDGPTAVEYAVMLAMIVMAALASIQLVGSNLNSSLNDTQTKIQAAGS